MRKLICFAGAMLLTFSVSTSCRMAPNENLGDTVEAKYFEPLDTTTMPKSLPKTVMSAVEDSVGM